MSISEPPQQPALTALHGDTGVQHERTALAWTRTSIALAVVGTLLVRGAHLMVVPAVGFVLGLAVLGFAGSLLFSHHERYRSRDGLLRRESPVVTPRALRLLALAVTGACLSALVGVVLLLAG